MSLSRVGKKIWRFFNKNVAIAIETKVMTENQFFLSVSPLRVAAIASKTNRFYSQIFGYKGKIYHRNPVSPGNQLIRSNSTSLITVS